MEFRHRLHRFHGTKGLVGVEGGSHFRKLSEYHVAQLLLSVIGNPNGGNILFPQDPLVFLAVQKIIRSCHLFPSFSFKRSLSRSYSMLKPSVLLSQVEN